MQYFSKRSIQILPYDVLRIASCSLSIQPFSAMRELAFKKFRSRLSLQTVLNCSIEMFKDIICLPGSLSLTFHQSEANDGWGIVQK